MQELAQRLLADGRLPLDLGQSAGSVRSGRERRRPVESHWIRASERVDARAVAPRAEGSRDHGPGGRDARPGRRVPRRSHGASVRRRARRQRDEPGQPRAAAAQGAERRALPFWIPSRRTRCAGTRDHALDRVVGPRDRGAAGRLERPLRRAAVSRRPTSSSLRRCSASSATRAATASAPRSASAARACRDTASRRRWHAAASSAATPRASREHLGLRAVSGSRHVARRDRSGSRTARRCGRSVSWL